MNFNKEIGNIVKDLNLGGKVVALDQADMGTPEDWSNLEKQIAYSVHENENMIAWSKLLATNSLLN